MTTTTRLYKQDQMTGKFKGQTQARVDEDRVRSYSCIMCTLVAARGTASFGFSKIR